jgi:hypothetical protein
MSKLTLLQMQQKLGEMFTYTSDLALGKNKDEKWLPEVRIAAAQASAQIATVLVGTHKLELMGWEPGPLVPDSDADSEPE